MKNSAIIKTEGQKPFCVAKRSLLSAVCFIVLTCACIAQDIIVTRDSKKIEAKVTEVNVDHIKYKVFDHQDGPVYSLLKRDILTILYQSGRVETFTSESSTPARTAIQTEPAPVQPVVQTAPAPTQPAVAPAQTAVQTAPPSAQTLAQTAPATVQKTGSPPSKAELKRLMALNSPHHYDKYKSGSTLSGIGAGMTLGGVAIAIIGFAVADKEYKDIEGSGVGTRVNLSGPGAGIFAAGIVSSVVGTPLWIVGGSKKKRTRNAYLREFGYSFTTPVHPSPYLQLNTAPNKVGLAFVF